MPVNWSQVAPYIEAVYNNTGRVERAEAVDAAYDDGASDDVVDALDAMGSRIFPTPEAAKEFLLSQNLIEG